MRVSERGHASSLFARSTKPDDLIAQAYFRVSVGEIAYVRPEDASALEDFQEAFAVAEEWQALGLIEILANHYAQNSSLPPLRFRRLK